MGLFKNAPRLILPLAALALFLRIGRYLSGDMANDASLTGRLGYSILDGVFPLFFLGQKFMGSLDAYLSAPFYLLAGPSVLTLNLLPVLCSLGLLAVLGIHLKKVLDRFGVLVGFLFLSLPPALLLYWAAEARSYYPVSLLLSALLVGVSWRAGERDRTPQAPLFFGWGMLAGLAFWTNFLSGVVIAACFLYLCLAVGKRLLWKPLGLVSGAALIGSAPFLVSLVKLGKPWLGIAPSAAVTLLNQRLFDLFFNSLPIVLGINPADNAVGLSVQGYTLAAYLLVLSLMVWSLAGLAFQGWRSANRTALLPLFIVLFNLVAALIGGRPPDYREQDQRYLLPLYLALPFCWGYLADRLADRRFLLAGLSLILVGTHVSGYFTFLGGGGGGWGGGPLLGVRSGYIFSREGRAREAVRSARQEGFEAIYNNSPQLGFLAGDLPLLSGLVAEDDCRVSALVDGAIDPGFWVNLEPNCRLLGLSYRVSPSGIIHSFSRPEGAAIRLDRSSWTARALEGAPLGTVLSDGDLATVFNTRGGNPDGQGFVLDLGREETAGGLILVSSSYREVPAGLRIEASLDGRHFELIREVRRYVGPFYLSGPHPFLKMRYPRVECYFPPHRLRFLRLTQLGNIRPDWPVGEVFLVGPGRMPPEIPWPQAGHQLVQTVSRYSFRKIYADAWPSALLFSRLKRHSGLVPPNRYSNNYGDALPTVDHPLLLDPSPGNGLLVKAGEALEAAERLRQSGIVCRSEPAGAYTLFHLQGRTEGLPVPLERTFSDLNSAAAEGLARGLPAGKRWTTGAPQRPGMGLTVDLGKRRDLEFVTLGCPHSPPDFPRELRAFISGDGRRWEEAPLVLAEPLAFTGPFLLLYRGPVQRYRLTPAVKTRFLRLELSGSDPDYWWSVEFIRLNGGQDARG